MNYPRNSQPLLVLENFSKKPAAAQGTDAGEDEATASLLQ